MAEMAGISVRSLFNYKTCGKVTAFKIKGVNRILFDAEKTMDELGLSDYYQKPSKRKKTKQNFEQQNKLEFTQLNLKNQIEELTKRIDYNIEILEVALNLIDFNDLNASEFIRKIERRSRELSSKLLKYTDPIEVIEKQQLLNKFK